MKIKLLLISIIVILSSCQLLEEEVGFNFDEEAFETNYTLWKESNRINYEFTQSHFSSSMGPQPDIVVEVENSRYKQHTIISNDNYVHEENLIIFKTVDDIYKEVLRIAADCKESINDPDDPMRGAHIDIEYDPSLNIPVEVSCRGTYEDDYVGGLSFNLTISNFKEIYNSNQ